MDRANMHERHRAERSAAGGRQELATRRSIGLSHGLLSS
jgi:hypothetical protein